MKTRSNDVQIITYDARYRVAFSELNRVWIEEVFEVEEMDRKQLEDPEGYIVQPGGEVLFLLEQGEVQGTCALIRQNSAHCELAKMAIRESAKGRGYGDVLMEAAIKQARLMGFKQMMLLSNTVLEPAINLYKKHGFKTIHLGPHPDYERANIEMAIDL
ncbi:MAG: GNAT family N-acetyltransferase [Pseudomonadota bacterium]